MSATDDSDESGPTPPLSERVVSAVAAHRDVEETALPPLFEVLDPDALDALFETPGAVPQGTVTFEYAGCIVECSSDGTVDVRGCDAD
ncbi:MAG: HalOD1 output domain-containing protein [Halosimplex sp.]